MRIASFVGQKGGVGKSTLARVLSVAAARQGHRVLLGDFDLEQLSCIEWSATRLRNGIEPEIETRAFKSLKKLSKTVENFELVVVDTRGLADELTADISQESDVVFLPTGTSMDDLRPTGSICNSIDPALIACPVLNPFGFPTRNPKMMPRPSLKVILTLSTRTETCIISEPYFSMPALTMESSDENNQ